VDAVAVAVAVADVDDVAVAVVVGAVTVVVTVAVVVVGVDVAVAVGDIVVAASTSSPFAISTPDVASTNVTTIFPPGKDGNVAPESVLVRIKPDPV
jgi:hypothetical protein